MLTRRAALKLVASATVSTGLATGTPSVGANPTRVAPHTDPPAPPLVPRHDRIFVNRFNQSDPWDRVTFVAADLTVDDTGAWTIRRLDGADQTPAETIAAGDTHTPVAVLFAALFAPPGDRVSRAPDLVDGPTA
jgi:predicted membrane-bound mannosyltransferase